MVVATLTMLSINNSNEWFFKLLAKTQNFNVTYGQKNIHKHCLGNLISSGFGRLVVGLYIENPCIIFTLEEFIEENVIGNIIY